MPHYREHNGNYVEITLYDLTDIQHMSEYRCDECGEEFGFSDLGYLALDDPNLQCCSPFMAMKTLCKACTPEDEDPHQI